MGICYFHGNGVEKDNREARKWYQKAADQNFALAQHYLGRIYLDGLDVEQDHKEAAKWFRKAADQGLAEAQHSLSHCYKDGWGVEKNDSEFEKWALRAAIQGIAVAQFNLGFTYSTRRASTTEVSLSVYWLKLAGVRVWKQAQDIFPPAQFFLSLCFLMDGQKSEAVYWLKLSANQGLELAKSFLELGNSGILDAGFFRPLISKALNASPTEIKKIIDFDKKETTLSR